MVTLEIEKYAEIDGKYLIDEDGNFPIEFKKYYLTEKPNDTEDVDDGKVEEDIRGEE